MGGDRLRTKADLIEHARIELGRARDVLAQHQQDAYGLCQCLRVWPCSAAVTSTRFVEHWQARLAQHAALDGPTQRLPHVQAW